MREINVAEITTAVSKLCIDACCFLPKGVRDKIEAAIKTEESPLGQEILWGLKENFELAERKVVPLCQDTGLVVVFIEIGQDVHFVGGDLETAINAGVAKGYTEGYLRKSSVGDPIFTRKNSGDNTPAIIHTKIVPGEKVNLIVNLEQYLNKDKEVDFGCDVKERVGDPRRAVVRKLPLRIELRALEILIGVIEHL